ncbi:diguanylate cyclase domain-containing protein [Candidatus Izemoplasma sp. B36]|uniref:sensor domain-containing diguanylate cyclase n=1 Tax=Candidatus Izemoplasma sp. B36 TaxID=3242468 RepID=UPI003557E977
MNELFVYISLGLMVLLFILSSLVYKKIRIWKLIIVIITGVAYGIIRLIPDLITFLTIEEATEYYTYILYLVLIVIAITFKNKIKITQNLTDYDFFELEKELEEVKDTSDLLRLRFISTIGLLNEGLIFYDDNLEGMFITEKAKEIINAENVDLTLDDYVSYIHEEDKTEYIQTIKKANKKNPNYEVKYRVKKNGSYIWVVEKGKTFFHKNKSFLLSSLKGIDMKLFPETMIHELDSIPNEEKLSHVIAQIRKEKEPFHLVLMHLTNIPDINKRFGRDVGNLMIAEYIKKMRYHFAKDFNTIFRITGIEFALVIKENQKYEVLKRALVSGGDLINLRLNIGGIQQVVYPNVGVVRHDPWSNYESDDLINLGQKALEEAIRNNKKNYSIFGE